jgi:hypothetical protein
MGIPLTGWTIELLFVGAIAAIVILFLVEITFDIALDQWTQACKRPPERPRFPWTDRTGT